MELGKVKHKWFEIGIQLGISRGKLKEFEKEVDPLSAIIDYWLNRNVKGVPISWRSVVAALESSHVDETGLANTINEKYCQQLPLHTPKEKGQLLLAKINYWYIYMAIHAHDTCV